jgi:hypothetical protein
VVIWKVSDILPSAMTVLLEFSFNTLIALTVVSVAS